MRRKFLVIVVLLCLGNSLLLAQKKGAKKGMFSYSINYADYGFFNTIKDSSVTDAFKRKDLFKSGNSSFGIGISYWKGLGSRIDFTGNLSGSFSNFPALFVKDDSIGQASFTPQIDALLHFRALPDHKTINPFLTGGIGAGYFGKQFAVYIPVGVGLQFHLNSGAYLFIQAQWKMALTDGIKQDFMFYTIGFGQQPKTKKPEDKVKLPAIDSAKKQALKDTVALIAKLDTDTDGDGISDYKDLCPTEKGTATGCPDADGDGIADKDDNCKDVKGVARYAGCPVADTDGDGVNDEEDKCVTVAGVLQNGGCPADADGDGIADKDDQCPDAAGTAANSGCPLPVIEGAKLIRSTGDSMTYFIRFDFDKSNITREAFTVLSQVVRMLKADKTLLILIDGHADNVGLIKNNLKVSADRANIASDYFQSYGIAKSRITTAFYGSSRPYDVKQDWLNRRVELTIFKKISF